MIRTRFAPSPTGELHIGGARTALFNYLFAKNQDGEFLLRIEDTDRERTVEGATERIIESLGWLGIIADNSKSPMIQSGRKEIYQKKAFELVENGDAYVCTCSKEELKKEHDEQIDRNEAPKYSGNCRNKAYNLKLATHNLPAGAVIRMKMPESGKIIIDDLIHGKVEFDASLIDDQIILKSDGFPTYHLASVVDDHEMEITHVIRSDEWLSSTPKHLVLYKMLGWEPPKFAHLSMILGTDHSKLSKRHGATSVIEYKKDGYLPEAIVNFIALLGWNPKNDREIFSMQELIETFKLSGVNKSGAVFDIEKLNYFNKEHQKNLSSKHLALFFSDIAKTNDAVDISKKELSEAEINLMKRGGFVTLKEASKYILKLRKDPKYESSLLIFKKSDREKTLKGLEAVNFQFLAVSDWQEKSLQKLLEKIVADNQLSNGDVFWPVRVALSGEENSPSPIELALALRKDKTLKRIKIAIEKISNG